MNTALRCSGVTYIPRDLSCTCTPHVHPLMEWTIHAFSFQAETGPHLPTLEGWKAKLAWVADYIPRHMSGTGKWTRTQSPIQVQTGPDLTSFIETNVLLLCQTTARFKQESLQWWTVDHYALLEILNLQNSQSACFDYICSHCDSTFDLI